jgi:hypothetical protein
VLILIHGERIPIHPEAVQHQVPAEFVPVPVFTRLQTPCDFRVGRRFLAEVPVDDRCELLLSLEYGKVQLRKEVSWKYDASMRVDDERL